MNENTYIDIFATKGIEYLIVIVYLALFVFFVRALCCSSGQPKEDSSKPGNSGTDEGRSTE